MEYANCVGEAEPVLISELGQRGYVLGSDVDGAYRMVAMLMYAFWLFPPLGLLVSLPCFRNGFRGYVGAHALYAGRICVVAWLLCVLMPISLHSHTEFGASVGVLLVWFSVPLFMLALPVYARGLISAARGGLPGVLRSGTEDEPADPPAFRK